MVERKENPSEKANEDYAVIPWLKNSHIPLLNVHIIATQSPNFPQTSLFSSPEEGMCTQLLQLVVYNS